jgi:hypothetical protein
VATPTEPNTVVLPCQTDAGQVIMCLAAPEGSNTLRSKSNAECMTGVSSLPSLSHGEAIDHSTTTATQPAAAAGPDVRQSALDPSVNHRIEGTSHPGRHHPRQARRGRRSMTRRRRLDLELLLIIRRAERQADLRGARAPTSSVP